MLVGISSVPLLNCTHWKALSKRELIFMGLARHLLGLVPASPFHPRIVFGWWPLSPFLKAMKFSTLTGKWLIGN